MKRIFTGFILLLLPSLLSGQQFRAILPDPPGTDGPYEYFEISGAANQSLSGKCFVVIEGDGAAQGVIDQKIDLGSFSLGTNGLLLYRASAQLQVSAATTTVTQDISPNLENGTSTYLLMDCPTQNVGDDLDTNNDGVLDGNPFNGLTINDAVGMLDGDAGDASYANALGGSTLPTRPGTTGVVAQFVFREGGTLYGATLSGTSPQIAVATSAWPVSGPEVTTFNGRFLSNGNTPSPLPITLTSFEASKLGQEIILDWTTTDAVNFSHFSIERSYNAKSFEAIGRIDAKATITDKTAYQFVDQTPNFGTNYYRLRQVDIDGSYEYSRIISANMTETSPIVIYPNPSTDFIRIKNGEKEAIKSYKIYTNYGRLIRKSDEPVNEITIQNLPNGIYLLQLKNERHNLINRRFIKI